MCRKNKPSKYEKPFTYFLKCPIVLIGFKVIYENPTKPQWLTKERFESMQQLKWLIIFLRQPKEDAAFCGNILQRERQTGQSRTGARPPLFLLPECTKDCDEVKTDWAFQDLARAYPTSLTRAAPLRRFLSVGLKSGLVAPPPTLQRPRFLGHRRSGGKEGRARQRQGRAASHLANYYRLTIPVKDLTPMVQ